MADAVTTRAIISGPRKFVTRFTNISDGTGETLVKKIDISAFLDSNGKLATYSAIDKIDYAISGFTSVRLYWDHATDDLIAILPSGGPSTYEPCEYGGLVDPRSAGGGVDAGDILLSTQGAVLGATYDITIHWRPKS